jgi:hypothetical protein
MRVTRGILLAVVIVCICRSSTALAEPDNPAFRGLPDQREAEAARGRKTLFGAPLNPQSRFGLAWFPETLRAPEMDLEFSELQVNWFHAEKKGRQIDEVKGEVEQAFGSLTLEIELPYLRDAQAVFESETGQRHKDEGLSRVEIGLRAPLFQCVSPDGNIDYTLVGAFELALPTNNDFSKDTEISPRVYQLLRLGEHFSVQLAIGYEFLIGPEDGGGSSIQYAATFGYHLSHDDLSLPGVIDTIPIFEIVGENSLAGEERGHNPVFGTLGFRVNIKPIFNFQPRIGIGYEFPINGAAHEEFHWGVVTSFVFEL